MEAVKWFRQAAEQGDAEAQYALGGLYNRGQGVSQDYALSLKWFKMAAEQGDSDAQFSLGGIYSRGLGVVKDRVRAHMWFNLAATHGNKEAVQYRDITSNIFWIPKNWLKLRRWHVNALRGG